MRKNKSKFKLLLNLMLISVLAAALVHDYRTVRANKKLTNLVTSLEEHIKKYSFMVFDLYQVPESEREELKKISKSQLKQDIFVYLESHRKQDGFFVEFGATDGVELSNTYMLERNFGWKGILAEPGIVWHERLKQNRPDSYIENLCVWKDTGSKLTFNETYNAELSTIDNYSSRDTHKKLRQKGKKYEVETITLVDLLKKYNAPENIDYLSIDTEGSEFEILQAFFKENNYYKIKIITCEHNYTHDREKIYELLTNHGYKRKYESISDFDDFYVLS